MANIYTVLFPNKLSNMRFCIFFDHIAGFINVSFIKTNFQFHLLAVEPFHLYGNDYQT